MKKSGIFLILALFLILLISCGKSTVDSSVTNCTTSGSPSSVPPSSSTKPQDTETPVTTTSKAAETQVTSTSMATETQPTSTSETIETDPTVIKMGFLKEPFHLISPLEIAYEIPKSCSLSEESVTITLHFGMMPNLLFGEHIKDEDYFEIYLLSSTTLSFYPLRDVTITEVRSENYIYSFNQDNIRSFSHSETIEVPLSFFSKEKDNWSVEVEYYTNNTPSGCNSLSLSYEKINGETIVFYPHHIPLS